MKVLVRLSASALAGALGVAVLALVLLPWLGGPALFGDDPSGTFRLLVSEHRRGSALEARDESVLRSVAGKQDVTREVIAGRLTLEEAADQFALLRTEAADDGEDLPEMAAPATPDRSELYRQVIAWASASLPDHSRERAEVLDRLTRELARLDTRGVRPAH